MSTFVVLATGESMSQAIADFVRGKCGVVSVSNAYLLAPWADALVSNDGKWWKHNPAAYEFAGRKFCGVDHPGTERLKSEGSYSSGCNSGLRGMQVAHEIFGATKLLLCGFDMRGIHYFGKHPEPLKNTTKSRFAIHIQQFKRWRGCEVVSCTPNSALVQFRMSTIEKELA